MATQTLKDFLNLCTENPGSLSSHVSIVDSVKSVFYLCSTKRDAFYKMYEELSTKSDYISHFAENPQNYSMLRFDIYQKEETKSDIPYETYSTSDALNLIIDIQHYLRETIKDCKPDYLHCALLTNSPYISTTSHGIFNKHGYHLQFINCFLSKDDNTKIADYFL